MAVYAEGMSDMQDELAAMQKLDMKSFAISDYKVTPDGSDTLVATYKVAVEGIDDGKDQSGPYNAASVWKKQKGEWQAIFHTNIKQMVASGAEISLARICCRARQRLFVLVAQGVDRLIHLIDFARVSLILTRIGCGGAARLR